jgi:hypothetical protein
LLTILLFIFNISISIVSSLFVFFFSAMYQTNEMKIVLIVVFFVYSSIGFVSKWVPLHLIWIFAVRWYPYSKDQIIIKLI